MHRILTKWIEPYVLLETLKKHSELVRIYKFDGFSKNNIKKEFLKEIEKQNYFGLYMKNVNIFYLFKEKVNIDEIFALTTQDYEFTSDLDKPFNTVDLGKAEAAIINL